MNLLQRISRYFTSHILVFNQLKPCVSQDMALTIRQEVSQKQSGWKQIACSRLYELLVYALRSRRPHSCSHATLEPIENAIVALRAKHPSWDARKLKARLEMLQPDTPRLDSRCASEEIFDQNSMSTRWRVIYLPDFCSKWFDGGILHSRCDIFIYDLVRVFAQEGLPSGRSMAGS